MAALDNFNLASVTNVIFKMICRVKHILIVSLAVALTGMSLPAQVVSSLGSLPLYFEAGPGRPDAATQFIARSRDGRVLISRGEFQIDLRPNAAVQARFVGANSRAQIHGGAELTGKINYLTGNDASGWRTGIPTFARVLVENLYPGINAVYYGNDRLLEYDLSVSPGANPATIRLHFDGAEKVSVSAGGELVLSVGTSEIRQPKPVLYQTVAGARREIPGGYQLVDAQTVAFAVGDYDRHLALVIDPILSYSTYFGGTLGQAAWAVAVNTNDGSIFVAGQTLSKQFTTTNTQPFSTTNVFQTNFQGGIYLGDAFVAKFDSNFNLIYLTYLGGSLEDLANCLAVNKSGNAFVGGYTDSPNFPIVKNINGVLGVPGLSTNIGGVISKYDGYYPLDGFVVELNPSGSGLIYSTFLGGSLADAVYGLAIDGQDNAYVTGYTFSTNLPAKYAVPFRLLNSTPSQTNLNYLACTNTYYNCNAFVAKISTGGANLDYLTYFGGNNFDVGYSIAVDNSNYVYIAGYTASTNFPSYNSLIQTNLNHAGSVTNQDFQFDAFAAKFAQTNVNGSLTLIYSTFLGETNDDEAFHVAVDNRGGAYVTGWTSSTNFPNTQPATNSYGGGYTNVIYQVIGNGLTNITIYDAIITTNVFLTKITNSPSGQAQIAYSLVFGGRFIDVGYGVAVDAAGDAFVAGATTSTNFPVANSAGSLRATNSTTWVNSFAGYNAFVTAFGPNGTNVLYSGYLGGSLNDSASAIAVDAAGNAYVVGQASSANFPVTTNAPYFPVFAAKYPHLNGTNDAFLAKILLNYTPALVFTPVKTNGLIFTWPYNTNIMPGSAGYVLEASTNLSSTNWVKLTNFTTLTNNLETAILPATNLNYPNEFFRLSR